MLRPIEVARYTGAGRWPMFAAPMTSAFGPGHCRRCGVPSGACHCGCRECRREAKELLIEPATLGAREAAPKAMLGQLAAAASERMILSAATKEVPAAQQQLGIVTGFIGGGCCTSLSVEYAPVSPTVAFAILIEVTDSEGTTMAWMREEQAGTPYRIKESIITTNPGAKLAALAVSCTARVRWCEVFSCGC